MKLIQAVKFFLFTFFSVYAYAETTDTFVGLETLSFKIGYDKTQSVYVHYNPSLAKIINKDITDKKSEIFTVNVMDIYLDTSKGEKINILYSDGSSADPEFLITSLTRNIKSEAIFGLDLYVPGNGSVYVSGHTDNYFDEHKKYIISDGKMVEVKQPFLYVGLETKAIKNIAIYSEKSSESIVANIPKGTRFSVLVASERYYLIKTSFGLVGWYHDTNSNETFDVIEGLHYNGD